MSDDENNQEETLAIDITDSYKWNRIVDTNEGMDLNQLSSAFGKEALNEETNLTEENRKILFLLKDITSMMLTPRSNNEPFQALIQMADGRRSALPSDLSPSDLNILSKIINRVSHKPLKARIGDLLWVCSKPKNPEHAKTAIDNYTSSEINPRTWFHDGKNEFERAYRLAKLLKDSERQSKIENLLIKAFNTDTNGFDDITFSIAEIIDELNILNDHNLVIAARLEAVGEQLMSVNDLQTANRFFELGSKKYNQGADESKYILMLVKAAECYALDAQRHFEAGHGSKLISSSFFETAIHAYRKIPAKFREKYSVEQRISALRHKLNKAGKNTLKEMGVIRTPVDGAEEIIKLSKEHVSGKKSEYEALIYFSGVCSMPNYGSIRVREEENMSRYFLSSLFGTTQYSSDGRVVAKTPAVGLGGDKETFEAALKDKMVRSFNNDINLNVRLTIIPALEQILTDHTIGKHFIFEICNASPLIPQENIHLISHAIWLGFEFDFSTAIHLITPQVEKIVRIQLKHQGTHTTHLDKDGIEHENGLSTLLDMKEAKVVFGEDLLFELKAVFTDSIGPNLRNEVAHGLLTDNSANSSTPVYAWWLLLRMVIHSLITPSQESDQTND